MNVKASNRNAVFTAIERFLCRRKRSMTSYVEGERFAVPVKLNPAPRRIRDTLLTYSAPPFLVFWRNQPSASAAAEK